MAIGFGLLGLDPRAFWAMTVKELEAAIRGRFPTAATPAAPSRAEIDRLMLRFPD